MNTLPRYREVETTSDRDLALVSGEGLFGVENS